MSSVSKSDCAVCVRNLVKRYGNGPPTLNKVNMTVNKGTIYCMLGASGCGKTTILSCIVGLQTWDAGTINVLGQFPGKELAIKLGYMPQDLALYEQLTVYEILQFYGKLYHIPECQLQEKWSFLKALLEFPDEMKLIRNMSGGQKRRASLALTLIHSPELLILDEPTVGLDPLLREKIWNYLRTIVDTMNSTIIITTHYIEEARCCDMIGVIRNGRNIAESSPAKLLENFNCDLLEDAVTKLCHDDEKQLVNLNKTDSNISWGNMAKNLAQSAGVIETSLLLTMSKSQSFDCETSINEQRRDVKSLGRNPEHECAGMRLNFQKIHGLTKVMALTLIRHPVFLVSLMIMPTIQCSVILASIGARVKDLKFGVVNHDLVNWKADCEMQKQYENICNSTTIGCGFINQIQDDDLLVLNSYENETIALEQVQLGNIWGYISIPANYSTHILELAMEKNLATNETLEGSRIQLRLDHSQYLTAHFILKNLYINYLNTSTKLAKLCGMSKGEIDLPLEFKAVYGDFSDDYVGFMLPGDLLLALYCLTGMLSALIFVADYKQGTLSRTRVAGLNIVHILCSHITIQSVVTLVQVAIVTVFQYFALGIEIKGSRLQFIYVVISFLTGISATSFGLILGIVCRGEIEVFLVGLFMYHIFLTWGGVCIPTETSSWFWQQHIGYVIPIKAPTMALRSAYVRGLGITHVLVWPGIAVSLACIILFSFVCVILFKAIKL